MYEVKVHIPHPDLSIGKGYLCTKQEWVTTCYKNFFGIQTQTGSINPIPMTVEEYKSSVSEYRLGKIVLPYYPEPACGWMKENYNKKEFIIIVEHNVPIDDYNREEVDPLFLGGRCSATICQTVYENILWMSFKQFNRLCTGTLEEDLNFALPKHGSTSDIKIWSPNIPPMTLSGTCKEMNYCGFNGYVTKSGHFFSLIFDSNARIIEKILQSLPKCSSSTRIIKRTTQVDIAITELDETLKAKADRQMRRHIRRNFRR